ncbi:acetyl-CoA carboxylase biotin carboxyl carrier protein [Nocardia goodfellowii]|uniref:Biotin carboxyl carrier protein of acetyl-CoA carboxylase n=1 Tax=Nocardia goodfellowii TaxID=882446 RepID=A0ABS4QDV1_9NOCA|nr:biotin/lipoyl-containing protein [Nocardia goodfellowii]MBP2189872.1 acetyl-CoA carboxylase biotin carboxyl carrier protein [Nocardia goodfellowii]
MTAFRHTEHNAHLDPSLTHMMREVRAIVADLDRQPRRLRVQAGEYNVDIEWAEAVEIVTRSEQLTLASPPAEEAAAAFAIESPLVGHFYRAIEPGADPFVSPGDYVEEGQVVAIVEAMKLMNQITAPSAGRIVDVLPADGSVVEFGQRLIVFEPAETAMEIAS